MSIFCLDFGPANIPGEDVVLGETRHEDLTVASAVAIIGNVDRAVGCLEAVGVGYALAFVENEAALPALALVVGQPGGELHAAHDARRSLSPCLTSRMRPEARRRTKKRATGCSICGGLLASAQVLPPSVEVLCMMPLPVRASIHRLPSLRSTIMCSCQSGFGKVAMPRRCQVSPWSVDTKTLAPRIGSRF